MPARLTPVRTVHPGGPVGRDSIRVSEALDPRPNKFIRADAFPARMLLQAGIRGEATKFSIHFSDIILIISL